MTILKALGLVLAGAVLHTIAIDLHLGGAAWRAERNLDRQMDILAAVAVAQHDAGSPLREAIDYAELEDRVDALIAAAAPASHESIP